MPGTRRRDPASASKEQEGDKQTRSGSLLHFNQPLSWKAGKAIAIADLLSRLQTLAKELRNLEPEGEVDPKDVFKVAQELASANLLAHKDKGIRAWTVCCVVDLLRICVPHAPFRAQQLKDIFTTIVNYIIPQLADPSSAYNTQHLYVLTSLAEVHSIALITDLDRPEQLILSLLTSAFDIVSGSAKTSSGEEVTKAVEGYLTQILVQVIDESSSISPELTDVIIAQFMRVDPRTEEPNAGKKKDKGQHDGSQSDLRQKTHPRAYEMAKAICVSVPEKMRTFIGQYFSNVIVDASESTQSNGHVGKGRQGRGGAGDIEDEAKDVKELHKAHRLIRELWRACPDVLLHVIPQVEAELSAESSALRLTATETLSDVAAGIGVAGCPPPLHVDPASYPLQSLSSPAPGAALINLLQAPMSAKPFAQVHASAYESFLTRKQDKAPLVRAAWATGAGRILLTSAGGIGFAEGEEEKLKGGLAQLLADADEKVRLAAIRVVGSFGFADVIRVLGSHGPMTSPGSVLATLSDRIRDRKSPVRDEAMRVLGRMWAAAAGEIERGNEEVIGILGDAPSKLLDAYYVNDPEVHALLDHVMFEYLLPLNYPPIKAKTSKSESSQKQSAKNKPDHPSAEEDGNDPDSIRVRRILTLIHGLDEKAKKVFFGMQNRQTQFSRVMAQYLRACEEYNGGVVDENEAEVQKELSKWVEAISKTLPESTRVAADLRKFAKLHDRRNYQLIRFCLNADSEYRTVVKAIKELGKRIQARQASSPSLDSTMMPLLYRCSLLIYSRSHVPGIMKASRNDERGGGGAGLAGTAHELLREMSSRTPEVLKTHIQELCRDLESTGPTDSSPEDASAADMLKACAEFARKFPTEIPADRKFLVAMKNYALFARSPRAAKHAVSIIMLAGADKKEMYATELMQKATKDCTYHTRHFLTRLATISQVSLLDPKAADQESETIIRITTQETLLKNREPLSSSPSKKSDTYAWSPSPDPESLAKEWSVKCLINFLRSHLDDETSFTETATPIYGLLTRLIEQEGEVTTTHDTPATQRPYLRLTASRFLLKLCSQRRTCEDLVTPVRFNNVALVAHDRLPEVRAGFSQQLKKLLAGERLNHRWYTVLFLSAFEPEQRFKMDTMAWLRSRSVAIARRQQQHHQAETTTSKAATAGSGQQNTVEILLARLLSLLSHHPDFPNHQTTPSETFASELLDFAHYILFYLQSVANDENLSLIFHVAQRVKQTQDAVSGTNEASERLYMLSDLAQAVIRHFADLRSHQKSGGGGGGSGGDVNLLQTWPGKLRLPLSLFKALPSHEVAQQIAERNYLPEEVAEKLEGLVKAAVRPARTTAATGAAASLASRQNEKKRKSDTRAKDDHEHGDDDDYEMRAKKSRKKPSSSALPVRKLGKSVSAAAPATAVGKMKTPKQTAKKRKPGDGEDDHDEDGDVQSSETKPARKSARKSNDVCVTNYAEGDSDEDDEEMEQWEKMAERRKAGRRRQEDDEGEEVSEREQEEEVESDNNGEMRNENERTENHDPSPSPSTSSTRHNSPTPLRRPTKNNKNSRSKPEAESQPRDSSVKRTEVVKQIQNTTRSPRSRAAKSLAQSRDLGQDAKGVQEQEEEEAVEVINEKKQQKTTISKGKPVREKSKRTKAKTKASAEASQDHDPSPGAAGVEDADGGEALDADEAEADAGAADDEEKVLAAKDTPTPTPTRAKRPIAKAKPKTKTKTKPTPRGSGKRRASGAHN